MISRYHDNDMLVKCYLLNYVLKRQNKKAPKHLLCLIIVKDNTNADLPVRGLVTGWLWRVVQTNPILLSSLFCSRPGWKVGRQGNGWRSGYGVVEGEGGE